MDWSVGVDATSAANASAATGAYQLARRRHAQQVTAPREAEDTRRAYLAMTPIL